MAHLQISYLTEEEKELMKKNYEPWQRGQELIRIEPGSCTLPVAYNDVKEQIYNWPLEEGDVFVFGWIKTGTTWAREMLWCLLNDCNIEKAKSTLLNERIPFIDMAFLAAFDDSCEKELGVPAYDVIRRIQERPSPKALKTHLPFEFFPPDLLDKCKVIMCLRNPKDVLVSYYHHDKLIKLHGYLGDFSTFFDIFMRNLVIYGGYLEYARSAWQMRNHPNMCIVFYEDMKEDLPSVIRIVAKFLQKEVTEDQVKTLTNHLSFKEMKTNNAVNNEAIRDAAFVSGVEGSFIRKGEVGDWKNYFTEEMNKRMDDAIEKHCKDIGLEFKFELKD